MRLSSAFPLTSLCRATQSYRDLPPDLADQAALMDMLAVRVAGAVAQPCTLDNAKNLRTMFQVPFEASVLISINSMVSTQSFWW